VPEIYIYKFLQQLLLFGSLLELSSQVLFDLGDQALVVGGLFDHQLEAVSCLLCLRLVRIGLAILAEDLVVDDLLVVVADGVDMILDGLHKQTAQGGAVRFPCDCAFLFYSSHASNPRVLLLTLQLPNLINELL
jgi:hypothetical protein